MAYALDNLTNGKGTYAETIVNGGTIKSTYRAIRQFLNGVEATNILTINGGTIEGANKAVFFHDPSTRSNSGTLTIGENANVTGGVYLFVTAGSTEWPVEVSIATSALTNGASDVTSKNVPDGYVIEETNGTIGVREVTYVAEVDGVKYETLQDAFANANGKTVVLLDNIEIDSETITIADGTSVTFDMNGKKITVTDNKAANVCYELFYIYGELTVTGNGTIELTSTSNDTAWAKSSSVFHNRGGVLTIENGTFTHLGGTCMAFVVDNSGNWFGDATTNIKDGELTSSYIAIRNRMEQNSHGASGKAILNVEGGKISGTSRAIWAQAASTSLTAPATGAINISGGEIGLIDTARSEGAVSMTIISGGTVSAFKGEVEELTVRGGTLESVTILTATGEAAEYAITADGLYTKAVAKVGDVNYATLAEAVANANGGTVTLLANVELTEAIVINANVTIDLATYTVANVDSEVNCVFNIENGTVTITNGTITTVNGQAIYAGLNGDTSYAPVITLENVTLDGADYGLSVFGGANVTINNTVIKGSVEALRAWDNAVVTVNGGTIECTGTDEVARAVVVYVAAEVTITNGTFTGIVDVVGGDITISGGTFTMNVTEYCATGYQCVDNGDGTYTVKMVDLLEVLEFETALVLGNDFKMSFYMPTKYFVDGVNYYAMITKHHADGCGTEDVIVYVTVDTSTVYQSTWYGECYRVVAENIAAREMNCDISCKIFAGETPEDGAENTGIAVSGTATDSVIAYAEWMLSYTQDEKLKTLIIDMLNYGAAAQVQFNHYTEKLANRILTDEQKASSVLPDDYVYQDVTKIFGPNVSDFEGTFSSISLESTIYMNFYIANMDALESPTVVISFTHHTGTVHTVVYTVGDEEHPIVVDANGFAKIVVDDLAPADAEIIVSCKVYDGEVSEDNLLVTVEDSIESYCGWQAENASSANLRDVCEKVVKYSKSAYAYFHQD
ncbi:MAG: hypothetical protein IKA02_05280 [Clostridia bacterium]|nr:hypothetical protein [Clostridia bacterium]